MLTLSEPKSNSKVCLIMAHFDMIRLTGMNEAFDSESNSVADKTIEFLSMSLHG